MLFARAMTCSQRLVFALVAFKLCANHYISYLLFISVCKSAAMAQKPKTVGGLTAQESLTCRASLICC